MRANVLSIVVILLLPAAGGVSSAQEKKTFKHVAKCPEGCEPCAAAVEKGLAYLKKDLESLSSKRFIQDTVRVSLIGLGFLMEGSTPSKGAYAGEVKKCRDRVTELLDLAQKDKTHGNWCLSFIGLFLAEIHRREPDDALKNTLAEIGRQIAAQQEGDGGWSHGPQPSSKYRAFSAVTEIALLALLHIRDAGVAVDKSAVEKGLTFLEKATLGNGAISYSVAKKSFPSIARTGMGVVVALKAGRDRSAAPLDKWIDHLEQHPGNTLKYAHGSFHLCLLYAAAGYAALGEGAWKKFREAWLDYLLATQNEQGASQYIPDDTADMAPGVSKGMNWEGGSGGRHPPIRGIDDTYRTAILMIVLQLPRARNDFFFKGGAR